MPRPAPTQEQIEQRRERHREYCRAYHQRRKAEEGYVSGWDRFKALDPERAKRLHKEAADRRKRDDPERIRAQRKRIKQAYNDRHPERVRESYRTGNLRKNYGITAADYDAMLVEQSGACAICLRPPRDGKRLAVDHDHESGAIRALLCTTCNVGLGFFEHRPDLLREAIEYLARPVRG